MIVPEPDDLGREEVWLWDSPPGLKGSFWNFGPNDLYVVTDDVEGLDLVVDEDGTYWRLADWPEGGYVFF